MTVHRRISFPNWPALRLVLRSSLFNRERNPEQPIALLRLRFANFDFGRQRDFALERSVIDLHRQQSDRATFVVARLGQLARAANQDALWFNCKIDLRPFYPGEIDTDPDAFFAAIRIDRRLPSVRCELKP